MIGRPTKYTENNVRTVNKYLKKCVAHDMIPYIEDVAIQLDVNDDTINEWSKLYEDFSATIKRVKLLQRKRLMEMGLHGKVNPSMAIFLLKANHDMIETQRIQNSDTKTEPISIIFTDVTTWRHSNENRKKLEESSDIKDHTEPQVLPQKKNLGVPLLT